MAPGRSGAASHRGGGRSSLFGLPTQQLTALVPVALVTMALLPFLSDMSRQSERWGPDGGGAALRNEVDHMPTDADLSPLVRMGTRLNRDALRAFLNDNVEQLADEVKREMSDGREDGGGGGGAGGIGGGGGGGDDAMDEGGGSSSSSSDAMVGGGAS